MKLELVKNNENSLLSRKEIDFLVEDVKTTPSRKDIVEKLAAQLGCEKSLVIVDNIKTIYGQTSVTGFAKVYKDKKALDRTELAFKLKRHNAEGAKEEKKAEAKPAKPA
ncbi:MAG: 30S ribosomal protein S24e [Candidatus Diapherotrites archaeon]|nr:30S ribosomal protein S24e [Candidatus Diapherotrites archaeon]